jgi:tetratricopeptide (TPR) repeat protein
MKWINQIAPTLRLLFFFSLWALIILSILAVFKYVFLTSCINVGRVKECVTSAVDSSGTLFAIGGILIAIVALVPTFWTDSKIRDAKKEIIREVGENIQESMQRLNKAQILIFEADKYQKAADLISKELLIEEAIRLWSPFKQEGDRKLGNDFSLAVISEFYQSPSKGKDLQAIMQGTVLNRDQIISYLNKAIFYLEETPRNSESPDRDILVNLACMYGCARRYEEMIRVIEQAIKVDENSRDDLQESKRLSLLMLACGTDRRKIEKLGKKIGKELPLTKTEFLRIINSVDLEKRQDYYIYFFGLRRQSRISKNDVYITKIAASNVQGQRLIVSGLYYSVFEDQNMKDILSKEGQPILIEEAFDEVDKELYVICFVED